MPGKYSHSVVLADYSSRGIISLPHEQHASYVRSATYASSVRSRSNSQSQSRPPGTSPVRPHTAFAFTQSSTPKQPSPSLSQAQILNVPNNSLGHVTTNTRRKSPTRDQPSGSRASRLKYDQVVRSRNVDLVEPKLEPPAKLVRQSSTQRYYRQQESTPRAEKSPGPSRSDQTLSREQLRVARTQPLPSNVKVQTVTVTKPKSRPVPQKGSSPTPLESLKPVTQLLPDTLRRANSGETTVTQIFNPVSVPTEPDFDGFSDMETTETSYFGSMSPAMEDGLAHSPPRTYNSTKRLETPPQRVLATQSRQSQNGTLSSCTPSDRPTATPDTSYGKLDSLTSQSSTDSWVAPVVALGSKSHERKTSSAAANTPWRLPEIEENTVFDPEIFSQDDGDVPDHVQGLGVGGFGVSSLGMISSGRDVNFEAGDDTESVASAACPPDIGRRRDDEEFAIPGIMQPAQYRDHRVPSPISRLVKEKNKAGLFARIRSKSRGLM